MSRFLTRTNFILLAIIALAAFLRLYRLDQLPPGFQFDQAFYVSDVLQLLHGEFRIFFAAPGGTEPLYPYLAMVGVALFGDTAVGLRLTGALIGTLTVPIIYGCARALFQSTRIALLSAFFAAISLWHIFFNRYGERVSLLVLFTALVFWLFWKAQQTQSRRYYLLAGLFIALALYTYPGSRVLPIALILLTIYAMFDNRKNARRYINGLLLTWTVAAIIVFPLGVYFLFHPDQFASHAVDVSIFVPHGNIQADVGSAFINNLLRILGMFFVAGDGGVLRNAVPGRPIFDPLIGVLCVVGILTWLLALLSSRSSRLVRRRAVLIAIWLAVVLAISLITDDAPNFARTLPALPAVMMLPAWGAAEIWKQLRTPMLRQIAVVGLGVALIVSTGWAFRDYFVVFAESPDTYYAFDTDKVELAQWINRQAPTQQLYIAPLLAQNGTISLLTRNSPTKTFDSRDTIILPASGKDALYVFPWEQEKKIETMATRLLSLGTRDELKGSNGGKLALLFRIPAKNLPDPQNPLAMLMRGGDFIKPQKIAHAVWADSFELLGYSVDASDASKRNLEVTLFFHALQPMIADYTFSIKVTDMQNRTWGQEDKWAGDNSYATTQWSPGDVIVEKFYPGLNACAPGGLYRMTVEAYNPKTMQALDTPIDLGTWRAEASPSNRLEDLEIGAPLDLEVAPQVRLLGYTLDSADVRAGDVFSLSLFWRGVGDGKQSNRAVVKLRDASKRDFVLADQNILLPVDGRGLCTFFDFNAPPEVAPGAGSIFVNDVKIGSINITR